MKSSTFVRKSRIEAPCDEVFRWHTRAGALERLTPPWDPVEVTGREGHGLEPGSKVHLRTRVGPFAQRFEAEHTDYVEGERFHDRQVVGPFERWEHTHAMSPDGDGACIYEDSIEYRLPFGPLGQLGQRFVRSRLERLFDHRHRVVARDLETHARHRDVGSLKVAVSGASGLVGSALLPFLTTGGHDVLSLVRRDARAGEATWDPAAGRVDAQALEGCDAVVHLAGENVAGKRWSAAQKQRIRASRIAGTRLLAEALAGLEAPPEVLVCASAVGLYGDRGDELLDEDSAAGDGFLAELCRDWEAAAEPAVRAGIRVVHVRFGVVLSPGGGALAKLLTPFKLGAGGPLGNGKQWMSWIALDDAVGALHHAVVERQLRGPVNAVAPLPVTNADFTRTLARVLRRPAVVPMPRFAARLAFGELADELLLASQRVHPRALERSGYAFQCPELELALRHLLGRPF